MLTEDVAFIFILFENRYWYIVYFLLATLIRLQRILAIFCKYAEPGSYI